MKRRQPKQEVVFAPPVAAEVTPMISRDERMRLGDVLISEQALSPEQLAAALNLQMESGRQLGSILVDQGLLDSRALTRALATQLGLPTVDLRRERPTDEALAAVPEPLAREFNIVPLRLIEGVLDVAVADGSSPAVREALASLPVHSVNVYLAPPGDVSIALNTYYRVLSVGDDSVKNLWASATPRIEIEPAIVAGTGGDAPIIRLVDKIITQGLRDRASDIHVEPTDGRVRIRYRIDGALREVLDLPASTGPEVVSRIKILAEMDIVERRRSQDGQFTMMIDGSGVDIRVATGATIFGETAVLRLLDKSRSMKQLAELGMPTATHDRYLRIVHKPYGMILCSGPTGSGKTTTLYATLAEISRTDLNVMTIEDPVEYVFPAVNQMQINLQADVTFAGGLKSILRQDPDVILVGEIRDQETARIAVQSALTGHMVMSSLHATDASSALYRLLDMGIEPFLVSSSIVGIVGQRLVRQICPSCTSPYEPTPSDMFAYQRLGGQPKEKYFRGTGCNYCSDTGYRDRVGVYEVLEVTDEIRQLIVDRATPHEVREVARQQGMRTMGTEAMALVANDVTTIDEVIRNVYVS
ncbi:MAG: pilus biosynthesis protein PilB [Ilumatobacteraceae bacterium]|nr:pilus biosynthesis protein PilB [Ilumatobacteraceae bacterium]MCU1391184.1 pilus biosynthesis protein PilB [Ilumatobacteraceae bacterium]